MFSLTRQLHLVRKQVRSPAELRSAKPFEGFLDLDQAGSSRFDQNTERSSDGKALATGDLNTGAIIDQQKVGINLSRQFNGFPLAPVNLIHVVIETGSADFAHLNPIRKVLGSFADQGRCAIMPQFARHRVGNPDLFKELWQQVLVADFNQKPQR